MGGFLVLPLRAVLRAIVCFVLALFAAAVIWTAISHAQSGPKGYVFCPPGDSCKPPIGAPTAPFLDLCAGLPPKAETACRDARQQAREKDAGAQTQPVPSIKRNEILLGPAITVGPLNPDPFVGVEGDKYVCKGLPNGGICTPSAEAILDLVMQLNGITPAPELQLAVGLEADTKSLLHVPAGCAGVDLNAPPGQATAPMTMTCSMAIGIGALNLATEIDHVTAIGRCAGASLRKARFALLLGDYTTAPEGSIGFVNIGNLFCFSRLTGARVACPMPEKECSPEAKP